VMVWPSISLKKAIGTSIDFLDGDEKNRLRLNERRFILKLLAVPVSPTHATPLYFTVCLAHSHAGRDDLAKTGKQNDTNRFFVRKRSIVYYYLGPRQHLLAPCVSFCVSFTCWQNESLPFIKPGGRQKARYKKRCLSG